MVLTNSVPLVPVRSGRLLASTWSEVKQRSGTANNGGSKLSDVDPFADVPVDTDTPEPFTEPEPAKKAPAKKAAAKKVEVGDVDGKVTITLKGGAGFDAPWIVIHAADIPDAYLQLSGDQAALLVELMDKVKKAGAHFAAGSKGGAAGGAPARPGNEAPPGTPEAPGPDWQYKTGVGKNGKTWKGWFPPRGSDASPVWL